MYIPVQKNINCEPCKECGARPVVEQLPKSKFRILCPNCKNNKSEPTGVIDFDGWNKANAKPGSGVLRRVS